MGAQPPQKRLYGVDCETKVERVMGVAQRRLQTGGGGHGEHTCTAPHSQSTGMTQVTGTMRYDTRCYFDVRSKADISQLDLPHGNDN